MEADSKGVDWRCTHCMGDREVAIMAQDSSQAQARTQRIAQALAPHFDQARLRLAAQIAGAQEGHLIEQTEMLIFDELKRLKTLGLAVAEPSVGFRRMACRLALDAGSSFVREEALVRELGMGPVSREKLRQVVEGEGQKAVVAQKEQQFPLDWQGGGCPDARREDSLGCVGVEGVMTRQVTEQEKKKRRRRVAGKRGARAKAGKELKPLPPRQAGADNPW